MSDNDIRTVSTLGEWVEWVNSKPRGTFVYASGDLRRQARERLGGSPTLPVRMSLDYDIGWMRSLLTFDSGRPDGHEAVFALYDWPGFHRDLEDVRAWLEGGEPIGGEAA